MKAQKILTSLFMLALLLCMSPAIKSQDAVKADAAIAWKTTTVDMGKIEQGKPVTVEFEFTNPSMVPLIINAVRPACGCTAADYPKEPIVPGKSGIIKLTYNAASTGPFTKSTTVTTNSAEGNTVLVIKGEVVKK